MVYNGITVIADTPGRRDAIHMQLSGPRAYIRLVSCADPMYDQRRIARWMERIKEWQAKGLQECYFMVYSDLDEC